MPRPLTAGGRADPGKWYMVEDVDRPYYWNPVTNATMWELGPDEKALEAQEAWKGIPAYQNDLLLSLADFSKTPIAQELLHNGQTLQVRHRTTTCQHYELTELVVHWMIARGLGSGPSHVHSRAVDASVPPSASPRPKVAGRHSHFTRPGGRVLLPR